MTMAYKGQRNQRIWSYVIFLSKSRPQNEQFETGWNWLYWQKGHFLGRARTGAAVVSSCYFVPQVQPRSAALSPDLGSQVVAWFGGKGAAQFGTLPSWESQLRAGIIFHAILAV